MLDILKAQMVLRLHYFMLNYQTYSVGTPTGGGYRHSLLYSVYLQCFCWGAMHPGCPYFLHVLPQN